MQIRTGETLHIDRNSSEVHSILSLAFEGECLHKDETCYTVDVECSNTTISVDVKNIKKFVHCMNEAGVEVGYYTLGDIYQLIV